MDNKVQKARDGMKGWKGTTETIDLLRIIQGRLELRIYSVAPFLARQKCEYIGVWSSVCLFFWRVGSLS